MIGMMFMSVDAAEDDGFAVDCENAVFELRDADAHSLLYGAIFG